MKLKLFTDGGSRGNPGHAGSGWIAYDSSSSAEKVLGKCGNYLGHMTNNQAEYEGLLRGITWVVDNYPGSTLEIYMDSLLIVNQINGSYRVKNQQLLPYYLKIQKLLKSLPGYTITHIRRELNSAADELANLAMDAQSTV